MHVQVLHNYFTNRFAALAVNDIEPLIFPKNRLKKKKKGCPVYFAQCLSKVYVHRTIHP